MLTRADALIKKSADLAGKKSFRSRRDNDREAYLGSLGVADRCTEIVPFKNRDDAFAALEEGKVQAMAGDKIVLVGLVALDSSNSRYSMLAEDFSVEPYSLKPATR